MLQIDWSIASQRWETEVPVISDNRIKLEIFSNIEYIPERLIKLYANLNDQMWQTIQLIPSSIEEVFRIPRLEILKKDLIPDYIEYLQEIGEDSTKFEFGNEEYCINFVFPLCISKDSPLYRGFRGRFMRSIRHLEENGYGLRRISPKGTHIDGIFSYIYGIE